MPVRLSINDSGFKNSFGAMVLQRREILSGADKVVKKIIKDVRDCGDAALIKYSKEFDRITLSSDNIRISEEEINEAFDIIDRETTEVLSHSARRIEAYHTRQLPKDNYFVDESGVELGWRWTAISSAGIYVPGGNVSYPSSLLMSAIPAKIAGVPRLAITVPTPDGVINPILLAAAKICEIDEIYRVGGAQAIAAMAYGTDVIAPVDKIYGPGNAYVTAAKRQIFGIVGIDMIAGPSEILVVADSKSNPKWIAADLLSQAEHDLSSQSVLITDNHVFADEVVDEIESHLNNLRGENIAKQSWSTHGAIIIVNDIMTDVPSLVDQLAPEHLEISTENPEVLADQIRNAGAIFLGRFTPEAIGDYVAGPSHVLPTSGSARFSSGLSVFDFLKRTSVTRCSESALNAIGPLAVTLADLEGLHAHSLSVRLRLSR